MTPRAKRRIEEYGCGNEEEELNAIREILQELILAGLARTDFFAKAAFHGGTQLRIFEGIRRFSEDLDFALVEPDRAFSLERMSAVSSMRPTVRHWIFGARTSSPTSFPGFRKSLVLQKSRILGIAFQARR